MITCTHKKLRKLGVYNNFTFSQVISAHEVFDRASVVLRAASAKWIHLMRLDRGTASLRRPNHRLGL